MIPLHHVVDHWVAWTTLALALWILFSGLDDLCLDAMAAWLRLRRPRSPPTGRDGPEQRIAVFLPLWREAGIAGAMIEHSVGAIRYREYTIFAGCYPNDAATLEEARAAARRFPNVRVAVCPHDGPTSKADCLNWIYERMLAEEAEARLRFEIVLIHDAEDVIHPEAFRILNRYCGEFDMVQLPVLPLETPALAMTHGTYCDEFAEFHGKDLPLRQRLGGFIPSAGVGTGYSRCAIDLLAASGEVFDRDCLTEDYVNGLRLSQAGCRQLFLPIGMRGGVPVATREYFPRTMRQAVRQRARWVAGIVLQSWAAHGWGKGARQAYWFWRDRKGLVGNPASLLANVLFAYGAATGVWACAAGQSWHLAAAMPHPASDWLLAGTLALFVVRSGVRAGCSASVYGWRFAWAVPLRAFWANWINGAATLCASAEYATARLRRQRLAWRKTEHSYPGPAALAPQRRRLGEILVSLGLLADSDLRAALAHKGSLRLGEYLVRTGRLGEGEIYGALSLQQGIPYGRVDFREVPEWISSLLPPDAARTWTVAPYRVGFGTLFVAGPEIPAPGMEAHLSRTTGMHVKFQFVTPGDFARAAKAKSAAAP